MRLFKGQPEQKREDREHHRWKFGRSQQRELKHNQQETAMKKIEEMTKVELLERLRSAKRRMDRYAAMGNDALFNIAKQEHDDVESRILTKVKEYRCADCGIKITVYGDLVPSEPVLCQRCDPAFASLSDNKHHKQ